MLSTEQVGNIFCEEELLGNTINITPITCKDFDNSTRDDLSRQWRQKLLIRANQQASTFEWMVDFQTDNSKKWNVIHDWNYKCFFGDYPGILSDTSSIITNNFTEISPEIKRLYESNALFNDVLTIALSEISFLLDKEMVKLNYQIKVKIEEDLEFPEWKKILISIKVQERNPKDIIRLWEIVEERVRKKIELIKEENEEEINKINENLVIVIE